MSRRQPTAGSGNYVSFGDVGDVTGTAFTVHIAVKHDTGGAGAQFYVSKWTDGAKQYTMKSQGGPPGVLRCQVGDGSTGEETLDCTNSISFQTWFDLVLRKSGTGAGALRGFRNGSQDGSGTSNTSVGNTGNTLRLMAQSDDGSGHRFFGWLAELAVWDVDLNDVEIALLGRGLRPTRIRPGNLKIYAPVWGARSPEPIMGGTYGTGSVTGTNGAPADHPGKCSVPMVV
jgi:hypothetical protein